jgi:hypothetical protein
MWHGSPSIIMYPPTRKLPTSIGLVMNSPMV